MKLDKDWLFKGWLDKELKSYMVLAYEQKVNENFDRVRLFPDFDDVRQHLFQLKNLKNEESKFRKSTEKVLAGIDWENYKLKYQNKMQAFDSLKDINDIIAFSLPKFEKLHQKGSEINEEIISNTHLEELGVIPLYNKEGYIIFVVEGEKKFPVFRYKAFLLNNENEITRVSLKMLDQFKLSSSLSLHRYKNMITDKFKDLPNPATFLFHTKKKYPVQDTLAPIAAELLSTKITFT